MGWGWFMRVSILLIRLFGLDSGLVGRMGCLDSVCWIWEIVGSRGCWLLAISEEKVAYKVIFNVEKVFLSIHVILASSPLLDWGSGIYLCCRSQCILKCEYLQLLWKFSKLGVKGGMWFRKVIHLSAVIFPTSCCILLARVLVGRSRLGIKIWITKSPKEKPDTWEVCQCRKYPLISYPSKSSKSTWRTRSVQVSWTSTLLEEILKRLV